MPSTHKASQSLQKKDRPMLLILSSLAASFLRCPSSLLLDAQTGRRAKVHKSREIYLHTNLIMGEACLSTPICVLGPEFPKSAQL